MREIVLFSFSLISGLAMFSVCGFLLVELCFALVRMWIPASGARRKMEAPPSPSLWKLALLPAGLGLLSFAGSSLLTAQVTSDKTALQIGQLFVLGAILWMHLWSVGTSHQPGALSRPPSRRRPPLPPAF